ncbi:MAG: CoA transferase [Firmicutes bacterium]|nr:CoA transferase [Bacillota bacterium]
MIRYKILDLSDERGQLTSKILADLGCQVIQIERPGGDHARSVGPFYNNEPDPENSLTWWAFNTSKKGMTLDITTPEGKEVFLKLAKDADAVIETYAPGYLDSLGLGYEDLKKINKGIVLTSITPFGQYGPYVDEGYKGGDLVLWALGGVMYSQGYPDRAPNRLNTPQTFLHTSLMACAGTLAALYGRNATGEGDHVDCAAMEATGHLMMYEPLGWTYEHNIQKRVGSKSYRGVKLLRQVWECKDGMVAMRLVNNKQSRTLKPLVEWMTELGEPGVETINHYDWDDLPLYDMADEEIGHIEDVWAQFFKKHTKKELFEEALKRRYDLTPVQNCEDLINDEQLIARGFFEEVEHEDLGKRFIYPGNPFKTSSELYHITGRAPHIGENNEEILRSLGYGDKDIATLKEGGII